MNFQLSALCIESIHGDHSQAFCLRLDQGNGSEWVRIRSRRHLVSNDFLRRNRPNPLVYTTPALRLPFLACLFLSVCPAANVYELSPIPEWCRHRAAEASCIYEIRSLYNLGQSFRLLFEL